jgi:hypothetical protein
MLDFATDAMKIVTGLQGVVAELLLTVEKAISDSARAERRAIWISVTAVIVAVAMTAVQIAYSEFQREPSNAVRMEATLDAMRSEIVSLREAQTATSARLIEALASSDDETAAALRELGAHLTELPTADAVPPSDTTPQ